MVIGLAVQSLNLQAVAAIGARARPMTFLPNIWLLGST